MARHSTRMSFKSGNKHRFWKGGTHDYWHREARKLVNCPKGMIVHHKDNDYTNNSLENLQILTQSEHVGIHNRQRRGMKCKTPIRSKYLNEIINLSMKGLASRTIAEKLNISKNTVLRARKDAGVVVRIQPGTNKIIEVIKNVPKFR